MEGPSALLLVATPGPCFTCRPKGQSVRSMCKGGVASTNFASEPVTNSWLNAQVPVSRMASERTLAHFISGPQVHTCDATTVLQSVFEGKGPAVKLPIPHVLTAEKPRPPSLIPAQKECSEVPAYGALRQR
jgi:hypothetical protein